MTRYFSEDAAKKIADTVRGFANPNTDITSATGPVAGTGGMRLARISSEVEITDIQPVTEDFQVMREHMCEIWVYDDNTEGEAVEKIMATPPERTGESATYTGRVYFLYPPERDTWFPVVNMAGKQFALQSRIFPVRLAKVGGEEGSNSEQCSFTYDVTTYEWGENGQISTGYKLAEEVDPTAAGEYPGGQVVRCELGKYVPASAGIACMGGTSTGAGPFILSCNEVFEVVECSSATPAFIRFGGMYDNTKSYETDTLVHDGAYQMISTTTTRERAAPQPTGEPQTKIGTVPTWAQVSGAGRETISGQRYTWASGGQLSKVRVYIPTPSGGGGGGGPGGG